LSLKRFFVYSFAVHALFIAALIFYVPAVRDKKPSGEFFTRLVSPDELPGRPSHPSPLITPGTQPVPPSVQRSAPGITRLSPVIKEESIAPSGRGGRLPEALQPSPPPVPGSGGESKSGTKGSASVQKPDTKSTPLREKLFDRSVIGDLAKRGVEREEKKEDTKFSFDAGDYKFLIYNRRLKERIESIWVYPPEAAARGIYGDLVLRFTIRKNGKLGAVEMVRTSGHKNLDDAAMKALRDGEPYWPLPDEWNMEAYTIEGRFVYTIYGYYIR